MSAQLVVLVFLLLEEFFLGGDGFGELFCFFLDLARFLTLRLKLYKEQVFEPRELF